MFHDSKVTVIVADELSPIAAEIFRLQDMADCILNKYFAVSISFEYIRRPSIVFHVCVCMEYERLRWIAFCQNWKSIFCSGTEAIAFISTHIAHRTRSHIRTNKISHAAYAAHAYQFSKFEFENGEMGKKRQRRKISHPCETRCIADSYLVSFIVDAVHRQKHRRILLRENAQTFNKIVRGTSAHSLVCASILCSLYRTNTSSSRNTFRLTTHRFGGRLCNVHEYESTTKKNATDAFRTQSRVRLLDEKRLVHIARLCACCVCVVLVYVCADSESDEQRRRWKNRKTDCCVWVRAMRSGVCVRT